MDLYSTIWTEFVIDCNSAVRIYLLLLKKILGKLNTKKNTFKTNYIAPLMQN